MLQTEGQRTAPTRGRGGTRVATFSLDASSNDELTVLGVVGKDEVFERMGYFLTRIMPVADRWGVQMALHPDDPPMPVIRGVERWNYPVREGYERFLGLVDSPNHGLNLCMGTTAEGLEGAPPTARPPWRHCPVAI